MDVDAEGGSQVELAEYTESEEYDGCRIYENGKAKMELCELEVGDYKQGVSVSHVMVVSSPHDRRGAMHRGCLLIESFLCPFFCYGSITA